MLERQNEDIKWKLISEDFLLKQNRTITQFMLFTFQLGVRLVGFVGFLIKNMWEFKNQLERKEKLTLIFFFFFFFLFFNRKLFN